MCSRNHFICVCLYKTFDVCVFVQYRVVQGSSNWQVETADWNLAGFLHYF